MPHLTLIYPYWPKLPEQTEFHLPPHGPVCLAASIPEEYNICFIDENVDHQDLEAGTDLVLLSMMLTCQLPRGFEIADRYRQRGVRVIAGGIGASGNVGHGTVHDLMGQLEGLPVAVH